MKMAILCIETVNSAVVSAISQGLSEAFPQAECTLLKGIMPVPEDAYNKVRHQYNSSQILTRMADYVEKADADIVLGVTQVDLYAPGLNFVFGEAQCPGKLALISLCRLQPEFYGELSDQRLFLDRTIKEAVHEVGHTIGLKHCPDSSCVMFFSNSIIDTDNKRSIFCRKCAISVTEQMKKLDS